MFDGLKKMIRTMVCPQCDPECDRLQRATALHSMSIDAVKAAQRKQARRLSDVRVTVEATLRQIEDRDRKKEQGS